MSLRDLLVDAVGQLDALETTRAPDGAITWSRAWRPFAVDRAIGALEMERGKEARNSFVSDRVGVADSTGTSGGSGSMSR